jgi:tetratricopeptide (TPR) repeat protein
MRQSARCLFILFAVISACSCESYKNRRMNTAYEQIRASGKTGQELFETLTEFERNNPEHFSSKVDLGGVFFLQGNNERAKDYFFRALAVLRNAGSDAESKQNTVIMYGSLARIALAEGDYGEAAGYAEQAAALEKDENGQYVLLKGHILVAQGKNEEALSLFDRLYPSAGDNMTPLDLRAYMYLLARTERTEECAALVDRYFDGERPYFEGLGIFASGVFEKAGQTKKAILCAFLEYEYYSSYKTADNAQYLKNIDAVEKQLAQKGTLEEGRYAINLLRSLYGRGSAGASYDNSKTLSELLREEEDRFFIEDYVIIKDRINKNAAGISDFHRLLQLEPHFSQFPLYYWNVWQLVPKFAPTARQYYSRALERIIALDKNGVYAKPAWDEISALMGYGAK